MTAEEIGCEDRQVAKGKKEGSSGVGKEVVNALVFALTADPKVLAIGSFCNKFNMAVSLSTATTAFCCTTG